ncbi:MAG: MFS transporter [Gammaproteobacteria bacterium]|nr:MFS transporter [Gammaproteobacteria bacterium]
MFSTVGRISSLLLGMGTLLGGVGLLGTSLGMRADLEHFNDAVIGVIMSAYFVAFIIGTFWCPWVIRRAGHIRAFAAFAAVASTTVILHALIVQPFVWGLLRAITGLCLMGLFIVMESWLNVLAPNERRGQIFAAYTGVNLAAMAIGQFLILVGDPAGFVAFGLASILLSLALVPVALTSVREPSPVDTPHLNLHNLYIVSPLGVAGTLTSGLIMGAFWGMAPVFAQGIGLSSASIALFMSATIIGGALLQWPVGHLSDRYDRRTVLTLVSFGATVFASVAFFVADFSQTGLILSVFLYGGLAFSIYALSVCHVNDHLTTAEVLNTTRGLLLLYGIGAAIGPIASGILMHVFGTKSLFGYFATALLLLGLFAIYRISISAPIPAAQQGAFVPMVRTSQVALEMIPRSEVQASSNAE